MKYLWVAVILSVLLQTVSNQEDFADEERLNTPESEGDTPEGEGPTSPPFQPPERPSGNVYFAESFTDEDEVWKVWTPSEATKDGAAKYDGEALLECM